MKKLVCMLSVITALVSCGNSNHTNDGEVYVAPYSPSENAVVVTPRVSDLGQGLDLQMLGELVKNSTSAQDVENKLNSDGSINNLDLDHDGNVDYIKVTEYGNGVNRGLSFTVDMPDGQTQEIATIQIENGNNNYANMNIQGNVNLYGDNGYYASRYSVADILLFNYLFMPHTYYVSPYRYGYYPRYYHPYHCVPMTSYRSRYVSRTTTFVRSSRPSSYGSRSYSPNSRYSNSVRSNRYTNSVRPTYSSSVSNRASNMSRPTSSQRSFTPTTNSRPSTGGFGNSSPRRSSSSSYGGGSSYSSPSRSSSSSYGGGSRSSYGGGSSSRSSSSFGSSSRSSFGGSSRSSGRSGRR